METETIRLGDTEVQGIRVDLGKAPLVLLKAPKGFVMCGYLNIAAVNKVGEAGCRVSGVNSFQDVLDAKLVEVSEKASKMGIEVGMTGREALERMG